MPCAKLVPYRRQHQSGVLVFCTAICVGVDEDRILRIREVGECMRSTRVSTRPEQDEKTPVLQKLKTRRLPTAFVDIHFGLRRRSTAEALPNFSEAPHLRSSTPNAKIDFSKSQTVFRCIFPRPEYTMKSIFSKNNWLSDEFWLTPLEPQSRFGVKPLKVRGVCPQNGTAVLKARYSETELAGTCYLDRRTITRPRPPEILKNLGVESAVYLRRILRCASDMVIVHRSA